MNNNNELLFLGDVVPYKPVRFKNISKTVINLECPITNVANPIVGKINIGVSENYLKNIFGSNLICACLGNNHILDYGKVGLESTLSELEKTGLKWFGVNSESNDSFHPLILEIGTIKTAFVSAVCSSTSPIVELDSVIYIDLLNAAKIKEKIEEYRKSVQRIVLYIHWGVEESSYPSQEDIAIARGLIEAGIDIIIGSHAHAPQPIEKYKNGIIAYSLGNFLMPEMKNIPSYFDEKGIPLSTYFKSLMIWNRISWGVLIDMATMTYEVKKYIFILNRIIELPFTPLDKYTKLEKDILDSSYKNKIRKHLEKRTLLRKICYFFYKPHIPQKLKKYYENRSITKFK